MADAPSFETEPTVTVPSTPDIDAPPAQERHPFRVGSFVMGLLALLIAGLYLVSDSGAFSVDGGVAGAVLLLIAGAGIVLKTVTSLLRRTGSG